MLFPSTARRAAICAALALATFSAGPALAGDDHQRHVVLDHRDGELTSVDDPLDPR